MRWSCVLVIVAGCGFSVSPGITVDARDARIDDGLVDAAAEDAPVDGPPLGPFTNIVPLTSLDSVAGEDDPTLTGDMLEIYFDRGGDIWFSVRASVAVGWPAPQALTVVNSAASETTTEISADGLELFFSSTRTGGLGGTDVYVATRPDRASPFGNPVHVDELATTAEDVTPPLVGNALVMYLSSSRAGGAGGYDLYRTARASRTQPWSAPVLVTSLATAGTETEPWVDPTETTLYLSGDGLGGRDLWMSTRSSAGAAWDPRVAVSELNSTGSEEDPWLSPDGHTMIFASSRSGNFDLYMATR
jgi:hypothetical protein